MRAEKLNSKKPVEAAITYLQSTVAEAVEDAPEECWRGGVVEALMHSVGGILESGQLHTKLDPTSQLLACALDSLLCAYKAVGKSSAGEEEDCATQGDDGNDHTQLSLLAEEVSSSLALSNIVKIVVGDYDPSAREIAACLLAGTRSVLV